jgi:hypothetical protein
MLPLAVVTEAEEAGDLKTFKKCDFPPLKNLCVVSRLSVGTRN